MAVLERRPHTLMTAYVTDGYEDEDGHYHNGSEAFREYMECDVVPAATNTNIINYSDGRMEGYEYEVILSTKSRDFVYGERVKLIRFGCEEPRIYKVKWFHRYQKQCKLKIGYDGN